jgi:hypothetical protein
MRRVFFNKAIIDVSIFRIYQLVVELKQFVSPLFINIIIIAWISFWWFVVTTRVPYSWKQGKLYYFSVIIYKFIFIR